MIKWPLTPQENKYTTRAVSTIKFYVQPPPSSAEVESRHFTSNNGRFRQIRKYPSAQWSGVLRPFLQVLTGAQSHNFQFFHSNTPVNALLKTSTALRAIWFFGACQMRTIAHRHPIRRPCAGVGQLGMGTDSWHHWGDWNGSEEYKYLQIPIWIHTPT